MLRCQQDGGTDGPCQSDGHAKTGHTEGTPTGSSPARLVTRDGFFAVDPGQRITHWSEAAARMRGITEEEAVGRRCFDVMAGTDARNARYCRVGCPVQANAQRGRGNKDFDIQVADRSGQRRIVNVSVLLCSDPDNKDTSILHLFRDVTARRRVEMLASSMPSAIEEQPGNAACALTQPTRLQMEVVRLLATGEPPARIAEMLEVSPVTVRNHVQGAMERLAARSRVQVVAAAARAGLL